MFEMETDNIKYEKVLNLIKNSNPELEENESITEDVMRQIRKEKSRVKLSELMIEFLFGWVYIGWVRKSMITATVLIIVFFAYQQVYILHRINELSDNKVPGISQILTTGKDDFVNRILVYKLRGASRPGDKLPVSEKEIDEMINSMNSLKIKYKNVFDLIEKDPQLKKYVEEKISESKRPKSNI
jgi:hypothetical protein